MEVNTTRFGALHVDPERVITFTQPIIGFPEQRRFVLIPGPDDSIVVWLQSVEKGDLAFLLMDPRQALPDYQVSLNAYDLAELAASGMDELDVYTLVVVPRDPSEIRTNLKAPILVNATQRLAKQVVCERSDYPIQFYLARGNQDAPDAREINNACSDT